MDAPDFWLNRKVILEFPSGELFKDFNKVAALIGLKRPVKILPITAITEGRERIQAGTG